MNADLLAEAFAATSDEEDASLALRRAAERKQRAYLALAESGLTMRDIAEALSVSPAWVHRVISRARELPTEWEGGPIVPNVRAGSFAEAREAAYRAAEERCRGNLVNPDGQARGVDGRWFFSPAGRRADLRYASRELSEHFAEVGKPPTWHEYEQGRARKRDSTAA